MGTDVAGRVRLMYSLLMHRTMVTCNYLPFNKQEKFPIGYSSLEMGYNVFVKGTLDILGEREIGIENYIFRL